MTTFADLGLSPSLLKTLSAEGYETPTPIQAQAIRVFDRSGAPALAVVRSADDPVVVGVLGEAYATRRLAEALDAARKGVVGY